VLFYPAGLSPSCVSNLLGELLETSTETVFATLKTGMAAIDGDNLLPLLAEPALPGLLNARCTVC